MQTATTPNPVQAAAYYSREISVPATKREGLANFVQIIINKLEANQDREALLAAVDLLEDINCGAYDDAMADAKGHSAILEEMRAKHTAEIIKAGEAGIEEGIRREKARMAAALKLVAL